MKKILILIGILVLGPNFLASAESQGDEVATLVTTTVETTTFGPDGTAKRTEKQHHRQIVPHKNGENLPEDKLVELAKKADKTKIHVEKKAETLGIWDTATKVVKGLTEGVSSVAGGISSTVSGLVVGLIPFLP